MLEEIEYEGAFSAMPETVARPQELLDLMKSRRTVRRFLPDKVSQQQIDSLLEAAQYVATGANCQCQRFTVLTDDVAKSALQEGIMAFYREYAAALADKEHPERLAEFLGESAGEMHEHILAAVPALVKNVDGGRDRLFFDAPVVILIHADRNEVLPEAACAFAANHIALMAHSLGLGSCITAYASLALAQLPGLRADIGIAAEDEVYYVVAVGKAMDEYHLVPPRKPVNVRYV